MIIRMGYYSKYVLWIISCLTVLNVIKPIQSLNYSKVINEASMNISVINGTTAELSCPLDFDLTRTELDTLTWVRSPRQLLTRGLFRVIGNSRISLAPMELLKRKALSLFIRPTWPEDNGEYRCTITINNRVYVHSVQLTVLIPPRIIKAPVPFLKVDEGALLELNCLATGYPPPYLVWTVNSDLVSADGRLTHRLIPVHEAFSGLGVPIEHRNGSLIIRKLNRKMNKRLVCLATNDIKPDDRREVNLSVRFAPEVRMMNRIIKQGLGMNTVLTCQIHAHPQGVIRWLFNHEYPIDAFSCDVLTNSEKKYCLQENRPQTSNILLPVTSKLTIFNLKTEDFGDYVCTVSTIMGESYGITTLQKFKEIVHFEPVSSHFWQTKLNITAQSRTRIINRDEYTKTDEPIHPLLIKSQVNFNEQIQDLKQTTQTNASVYLKSRISVQITILFLIKILNLITKNK